MNSLNEVRFIVKEATRLPPDLVNMIMTMPLRFMRAVVRIQAGMRAARPRAVLHVATKIYRGAPNWKFNTMSFGDANHYIHSKGEVALHHRALAPGRDQVQTPPHVHCGWEDYLLG